MATVAEELINNLIDGQGIRGKHFSLNQMLHELAKRTFDLIVALIGLIILSPFFLLFSILIKRDTPGPAFFWCLRMGKGVRPFRMLKFRTMYETPESYAGLPVTCEDDERITPIGRWLRDTKINELPQLWNVLIGEMSMVGPRPEDVGIAENWPQEFRNEILSVRPGITSPASILYHDEEHLLTRSNVMGKYVQTIMPDKMRLDRLYVRNQSLSTDLDLIFWTLVIIIPRMAKEKILESHLFAGPIFRLMHRYISWFLIDLVIALTAVGTIGVLWRFEAPLNWGFNYLAALALVIAFVFSGFNFIAGLSRILWEKASAEDALSLAVSSGIVTLLLIVFNYLQAFFRWFSMPPLPVVMICAIGLMTQIGFMVVRFRWRLVTAVASRWITWRQNAHGFGEKVLIVGSGEGYQVANWLLRRGELQNIFSIIGLVDDDNPTIQGMRLGGCQVLGRTADIPDLVKKYDVGVILFTNKQIAPEIKEYVFQLCQVSNVRVAYIDNLIESVQQQLTKPVTSLEHSLWSEDHLKFLAVHDSVTGLPNRFLFQDQLMRSLAYARRYKTRSIVLFISLQVKIPASEMLGSKTCDILLKEYTKRLLKLKRESDTLAHLDELKFGLILEHIENENVAVVVAKRVFESISQPIVIDEQKFHLSAKISLCTNLDCYPLSEIGNIRWLYDQGKEIGVVENDKVQVVQP